MRFEGKVAVITGGAKGFGQGMAIKFAKEGAKAIICDMLEPDWQHENVEFYKLNVTDEAACKAFYDHVIEKYKKVDILVNNAGITRDALTRKMTDEQWDLVMNVNLNAVFYMTRLFGPHMEDTDGGCIINMSSSVGESGNIGQANYAASKSALLGLTKTWAKEFARKGVQVRCNAITPGYIKTDIIKTVPQNILDANVEKTMLKRLGEPEEVINVALFLASDDASYVTGAAIPVNGGLRY